MPFLLYEATVDYSPDLGSYSPGRSPIALAANRTVFSEYRSASLGMTQQTEHDVSHHKSDEDSTSRQGSSTPLERSLIRKVNRSFRRGHLYRASHRWPCPRRQEWGVILFAPGRQGKQVTPTALRSTFKGFGRLGKPTCLWQKIEGLTFRA